MVEWVRVRADMPPGHVRTPVYLRGKTGWVERHLGPFPNPEALAYGHDGTPTPLMRIRFTMSEIWGTDTAHPDDTVDAEIYAHWLENIEQPHAP
ncbi:SH3-like domain-containing protein [Yoonia sp. BS5-3]|uniref:SH3-like domain-containing protein n=1 Tax=Yoonia phaeophyticola TaxID=3137369 RepID=A0ABZ2V1B5_9RHOB